MVNAAADAEQAGKESRPCAPTAIRTGKPPLHSGSVDQMRLSRIERAPPPVSPGAHVQAWWRLHFHSLRRLTGVIDSRLPR